MMNQLCQLRRKLKAIKHDSRGLAYLEFALSLPILLLLFAATIDLTRMVLVSQKMDKATFTVGDLVTQLNPFYKYISGGVCNFIDIHNGNNQVVKDIMLPFRVKNSDYGMRVTSIINGLVNPANNTYRYYKEWSIHSGAQPVTSIVGGAPGSTLSAVNAGNTKLLLQPNERVILTEMVYKYEPILPWSFDLSGVHLGSTKGATYHKSFILRGRNGTGDDALGQGILSEVQSNCS